MQEQARAPEDHFRRAPRPAFVGCSFIARTITAAITSRSTVIDDLTIFGCQISSRVLFARLAANQTPTFGPISIGTSWVRYKTFFKEQDGPALIDSSLLWSPKNLHTRGGNLQFGGLGKCPLRRGRLESRCRLWTAGGVYQRAGPDFWAAPAPSSVKRAGDDVRHPTKEENVVRWSAGKTRTHDQADGAQQITPYGQKMATLILF
jgi:hypothetical protein